MKLSRKAKTRREITTTRNEMVTVMAAAAQSVLVRLSWTRRRLQGLVLWLRTYHSSASKCQQCWRTAKWTIPMRLEKALRTTDPNENALGNNVAKRRELSGSWMSGKKQCSDTLNTYFCIFFSHKNWHSCQPNKETAIWVCDSLKYLLSSFWSAALALTLAIPSKA